MKRVLTALVLIPLVLLLIFRAPFWLLTLVCALVAGLALWEYLGIADATGAKTPRIAVLAAMAALFACAYFRPEYLAPVLGALASALFLLCAFRSPLPRVLPDTAYAVFGLLYIALSMISLLLLSQQPSGASLLLLLFLVVWTGDSVALYTGRAFGQRRLAPKISPGKTWAGTTGSVAGSIGIALALVALAQALSRRGYDVLSYPGGMLHWALLAVLLNVAGQVGDLVESALKRGAGVKDSGALLPGHGGMLDRVDALLLAAPVLWYAQLIQQSF